MVIGGIVVAALGFVLIGAFITLGQGLGTFMEGSTLETLTVGQCFNGGRPEPSTEGTPLVGAVDMVDCDMPHESELVGTFVYPAAPAAEYPGTDIVGSYAEAECYLHFERYVGVPFARSRYELTYVTPLEFNWLMSDRSVQCVVHPPAGQEDMTGSVRGSSR